MKIGKFNHGRRFVKLSQQRVHLALRTAQQEQQQEQQAQQQEMDVVIIEDNQENGLENGMVNIGHENDNIVRAPVITYGPSIQNQNNNIPVYPVVPLTMEPNTSQIHLPTPQSRLPKSVYCEACKSMYASPQILKRHFKSLKHKANLEKMRPTQ